MRKLSLYIIFVLTVVSCRPSNIVDSNTYREGITIVAFCDLPKFRGQQVFVKGYYSGIDEYWSFNNGRTECKEKFTVDLQSKDDIGFVVPVKFEDVFQEVHKNYHNTYLEIEAVGIFENDRQTGYGHIGTNNSRFVVSKLIKATLIKK